MRTFAGTGRLARLVLRRDRVVLPAWVALLAALPLTYAASIGDLYPTAEARQALTTLARSPAQAAVLGPVFDPSLGGLTAWRCGFALVLVGLASGLTVVRHTRAEEEAGRRELLGSAPVGRVAPLAAALGVTVAADLVLGALVAGGLIREDLPLPGAAALGLSMAATGWLFAALAAVAAQLSEGARPARGILIALLGLAYVVRAVGDVQGAGGQGTGGQGAGGQGAGGLGRLSWASPLGIAVRVRPFAGERWELLALLALAGCLLATGAVVLSARRDLGAGVFPMRPGPAYARSWLRSPLALAWCLHRATLLAWTCGFGIVGAALGAASRNITTPGGDSPALRDLLSRLGGGGEPGDSFLAAALGILGLAAAAYTVQATLRLRGEEAAQHTESLLATSVGRGQWAASHLVVAALGPAAALAAAGVGAGGAAGMGTGDVGRELPRTLLGALVQLPAVWVFGGIAMLLFGLAPRLVALTWGVLVAVLLLGQIGPLLRLDPAVLDLSPFTHVPKLPGGSVQAAPLLWLLAVAVALAVAGLAGWRRRDVG